jgi:single-stranded-DNA-specific exonuclease
MGTAQIKRREPVAGADAWQWPDDCHPVLRQIYARRNLRSPEELTLALARLRPVGEFASAQAAVEVLLEHRDRRIVIFGDFDADGATSTALMVRCLRDLGFSDVQFFVPDRFELGYGLTPEAVEQVRSLAPALIVTVDNGTTSIAGVSTAGAHGIDVLVTDHHLPGDSLPDARAIVNPNLPGDEFAGKHLAGVGVAFYLLAALGRALGQPSAVARYLDLVALGTMADVVHLDHSNRILISDGIDRIRAGRCVAGLRALCRVSGIAASELRSVDLAYQLAPRLNAAGRLDDMAVGVRCLLTDSEDEAARLAAQLDGLNRERRKIEAQMRAEAIELVSAVVDEPDATRPPVVCLYREDWHEGVVGLVASKIKERTHRPSIAFARASSGVLKGSARSIPGFHIRDALAEVDAGHPGLIAKFGGHAMAAGLTLAENDFEQFATAIGDVGGRHLRADMLTGSVLTDGELAAEHLTREVAEVLRAAGPWGQGFPEPTFDGVFVVTERRVVGDAHLKLRLRVPASDMLVSAIAFGQAEFACAPGDTIRLVYRLDVDDYGSRRSIQLIVEHLEAQPTRQHGG